MITAEEFATECHEMRMPRGVSYQKEIGELMDEYANIKVNLHLDAAIKEFANYLFSSHIDGITPMNYEEWLRHYKIRNKLNL